ncbi:MULTISPECIES: FHA domain-containing protein [unclassified Mycolicibacterium]|uniref:FHA domain protein n=1 Tax=Mycolicibacterium sp. CBMA 213 TaxID=1968788 RepID=A0A1S6GKN7_9MYCO|nr:MULTISPECIES: FHA domain-containing protein [unclassified Mycolicibacterium]AQS22370.1 FHA domain protein [Mycolicibacterium sp. CBMA 213]MUM31061.1 FHA domain-containing protein [Mycolicibacterium sp. CBMA 361]
MGDSAVTDGPDLMVTYDGRTSIRHAADGPFIIGREQPPSDLTIDHFAVSRVHARLIPGEKQWCLVDYESRNGIYLDGIRVRHSTPVADGMTVHLANPNGVPVTFSYLYPEDITAPAAGTAAAGAPAQAEAQTERPEETRYDRATAQLRGALEDVMMVPGPGQPRFARTALPLMQRLVHLRTEFIELSTGENQCEARALLTCVEVILNALLIRMSACA